MFDKYANKYLFVFFSDFFPLNNYGGSYSCLNIFSTTIHALNLTEDHSHCVLTGKFKPHMPSLS